MINHIDKIAKLITEDPDTLSESNQYTDGSFVINVMQILNKKVEEFNKPQKNFHYNLEVEEVDGTDWRGEIELDHGFLITTKGSPLHYSDGIKKAYDMGIVWEEYLIEVSWDEVWITYCNAGDSDHLMRGSEGTKLLTPEETANIVFKKFVNWFGGLTKAGVPAEVGGGGVNWIVDDWDSENSQQKERERDIRRQVEREKTQQEPPPTSGATPEVTKDVEDWFKKRGYKI